MGEIIKVLNNLYVSVAIREGELITEYYIACNLLKPLLCYVCVQYDDLADQLI
jgi:hypothetical protein